MARILIVVAFLGVIGLSTQQGPGAPPDPTCPSVVPESISKLTWPDMYSTCVEEVKVHIKAELTASLTYIAMGAHFLSSTHFRPGIAKMLLKHAGEERQHAMALMDYLLMRGEAISNAEIPTIAPTETSWTRLSVFDALSETLAIEKDVRNAFIKIINVCEEGEGEKTPDHIDYHISDFLTGNFLEEQHHGVHEISNLLSRLGRLTETMGNSAFAEIEFDRSLLKED